MSISLFGNSSRLNPLTLAGSATGALSTGSKQRTQRPGDDLCWLTNVQVSADAYLVSKLFLAYGGV